MVVYEVPGERARDFGVSSRLEWVLPNGLGGYAMGTVSGANTRRYHAHLVAALQPPTGRTVLLDGYEGYVSVAGRSHGISTNQYVGAVHPEGYRLLRSFRVGKAAEWTFDVGPASIRKRHAVHPGQNVCTTVYENLGPEPAQLVLRPLVCHKDHHGNFRASRDYPQVVSFPEGRTVVSHGGVSLVVEHPGAQRVPTAGWYYRFEHHRELDRGLDGVDDLFCPCELTYNLNPGERAVLVAGINDEDRTPLDLEDEPSTPFDLVQALKESALKHLVKTDRRVSIVAGYPWFTDWGRDTMIALPGVCLSNGLVAEARHLLRDYAGQMRDGLIPNRFVDSGDEPEYNTVDATLWFANAAYRTLMAEWDEPFAREVLGWLKTIRHHHLAGTAYGIKVDPSDGLLSQGERGVQLTWMDAIVDGWVVTPRHGKPVEVNGLWINLLRIGEWVATKLGEDGKPFADSAAQAEASFMEKFWHPRLSMFLDTVDPDDATMRPNQVIAMGLPFSPIGPDKGRRALERVEAELLTPYGLRTLSPKESGYRGRFEGSMANRDAAYHQGTVWPWLLGPYVSAVMRLTGDHKRAMAAVADAGHWMRECGLGGIAEVYDGNGPQVPGGCPWQAWSVAEALRVLTNDLAEA